MALEVVGKEVGRLEHAAHQVQVVLELALCLLFLLGPVLLLLQVVSLDGHAHLRFLRGVVSGSSRAPRIFVLEHSGHLLRELTHLVALLKLEQVLSLELFGLERGPLVDALLDDFLQSAF